MRTATEGEISATTISTWHHTFENQFNICMYVILTDRKQVNGNVIPFQFPFLPNFFLNRAASFCKNPEQAKVCREKSCTEINWCVFAKLPGLPLLRFKTNTRAIASFPSESCQCRGILGSRVRLFVFSYLQYALTIWSLFVGAIILKRIQCVSIYSLDSFTILARQLTRCYKVK